MTRKISKPFNYKSRPLLSMRSPTAEEQRIGEIIDVWFKTHKFSKKDEDKYKEAFKSTLKAYLKTTQGKRLKDLMLSRDVLPITLMVSGAALAALLANEGDIPSIPEIELTKKLKVSAEIKGNIRKFTGVVINFSLVFGGVENKVSVKTDTGVVPVSEAVIKEIAKKVDDNAVRNWIIKQAAWEYEIAGPREENQKREFRDWVKNPKVQRDELPSMHIMADKLAAKLIYAIKNKKREVELKLVDRSVWPNITDRTGVFPHLKNMVTAVASILGGAIDNVDRVTFVIVPGIRDHTGRELPGTRNKPFPILTRQLKI